MLRLLVVDDSALMRRKLSTIFEEAGGFEIKQARNGREAVEQNLIFEPDVVTMDINMPEMDGLTALTMLMAQRPVPVVMFSSLTANSALATFEALALGAVDYAVKPGGTISLNISEVSAVLVEKVRQAARTKLRMKPRQQSSGSAAATTPAVQANRAESDEVGLVLIGVSTGGPRTLEDILPLLPGDFPWPILIAQHMPSSFTGPFARRLDAMCQLSVEEVTRSTHVLPGHVYIGRGDADLHIGRRGSQLLAMPKPERADYLWHPSVELLGRSALEHCPAHLLIAVMLTGMGHDGATAFAEIHRRGGRTIAESEQTAVVFGMPAKLIEQGGANVVLPASDIARHLIDWTR